MTGDKKRREPKSVPPLEVGGIRYEAPFQGVPYGYRQDGGIVVARDVASKRLLWAQKIYSISHDDSREDDKQDVFITSMILGEDGKSLFITNERGEHFQLDLSARVQ